ncbi:sigma-54 interaction domain-containing protein [Nitrospina watsonii]|uniref:Transcriptional regulator, NifA subfamily, Fis Family n=1 Tax=Nitrospina watsonii TaxID=1323948 RepID=A0ABM9H9U8_9BACT|nr:sigma 54-interacting transcriptional regulator [Nitrospina watsonii]CAI2716910.1 Transcriptional regulator, NifA subfamily, Fis Family [Nitrospina watsonii]
MKQINQFANILTIRNISSLFKTTFGEVDALLKISLETGLDVVGCRNASLLMFNEQTKTLQFYQASGEDTDKLKMVELPLGVGIAGLVAKTGEPIISNNVRKDERWFREVSEMTDMDVQSIACFPLTLDGKVLGVVQMLDKEDDTPFDEADHVFLDRFARMMALFLNFTRNNEMLGEEFDRLQEKYRKRYSIVGESATLRRAISQAERVANSKAAVLITGESGTGKELFAHLIHDRSSRQMHPFISISCGALPGSILERELFGHEKGAFTGADSRKIGLFEAADKGTLFLDEIGEMPLDMQVKLLRVIQEESFMRLGDTATTQVDVRIISATNRDLEKMVQEGTFRQDLFYRLNVINIELPPLRDRHEDIQDLVHYFIRKHTPEGEAPKKFPKALLSHLEGYHWPGNIRQLENAVERAIVLEEGNELNTESFPFESTKAPLDVEVGATLKDATDTFRRSFILNTLKSTSGNRTKAAQILDVQRSYLSRLIKELNIA